MSQDVYVLVTELVTGEETRHYVGTSFEKALAMLKNSTYKLDTGEEWILETWEDGELRSTARTKAAILCLEGWPGQEKP